MYNDTKFVISNKLRYPSNAFVHGFANCGNKILTVPIVYDIKQFVNHTQ